MYFFIMFSVFNKKCMFFFLLKKVYWYFYKIKIIKYLNNTITVWARNCHKRPYIIWLLNLRPSFLIVPHLSISIPFSHHFYPDYESFISNLINGFALFVIQTLNTLSLAAFYVSFFVSLSYYLLAYIVSATLAGACSCIQYCIKVSVLLFGSICSAIW